MVLQARQLGTPAPAAARKWYGMLEPSVCSGGFIRFEDLFLTSGLGNTDSYTGMLGQLAHVAGQRVELSYYQSMRMAECSWPLRADGNADGQDDWSVRAIDRLCMHHVRACRRAAEGARVIGMAVDKFNARSLDLANACIVLPSNVGFEAVPQVHP